jgi:hypothetical protein
MRGIMIVEMLTFVEVKCGNANMRCGERRTTGYKFLSLGVV